MYNQEDRRRIEASPTAPMSAIPKPQSKEDFWKQDHEIREESILKEKIVKKELVPFIQKVGVLLSEFETKVRAAIDEKRRQEQELLAGKELSESGTPRLTYEETTQVSGVRRDIAVCSSMLKKIAVEQEMIRYIQAKLEDETGLVVLSRLLDARQLANSLSNSHRTLVDEKATFLASAADQVSAAIEAIYADMKKIVA